MQRIDFIVNPISGHGKSARETRRSIDQNCSTRGRDITVAVTQGPGDATRMAARSVAGGADMVVAVGGDGTVNEVARALIGSSCVLGVVPRGSGNGFARNFGVPLSMTKALQALDTGTVVAIDVGFINGTPFFNMAGFGLDAEICFAYEEFGRRGPLPYFWLAIEKFLRHRPETVTIRHERGRETFSTMLFSIANLPQYGSGAVIAPLARGNDGRLDVCTLDPTPVWRALANAPRLFNRTIHHMNGYRTFRTKFLEVFRETPGAIHVDGNPLEDDARLCIEVRSRALRVAAPVATGSPFRAISTGIRSGSGGPPRGARSAAYGRRFR